MDRIGRLISFILLPPKRQLSETFDSYVEDLDSDKDYDPMNDPDLRDIKYVCLFVDYFSIKYLPDGYKETNPISCCRT